MKKQSVKLLRLSVLLLAFLLILPSCRPKTPGGGDTETGNTTTGGYENPVEVVDLGGKEYRFMGTLWHSYEPLNYVDIAPKAGNGDMVVDAAYSRLLYMQETYKCDIVLEDLPTKEVTQKLEQNSMAGAGEFFDFVLLRGSNYVPAINGGYLADLSNFNISTNSSWWDSAATDALTINSRTYGMIGDVTVNHLMAVWMVCFNKTMVTSYELPSPYELVDNGEWTFERVIEIAKGVARDDDGVTGMGPNDLWGINYTRDTVMGVLMASGVEIVTKDANGIPELTIHRSQARAQEVLEKLYDESFAVDTMNPLCKSQDADTKFFDNGRCLFLFTATHNATALRNSETDYGIVPYPKWSTDGEYISTTAGSFLSILSIPRTNTDYRNASILLDAFAAYGQAKLRPQFYENVLLRRVGGRDQDSYFMLQYIFENLRYDMGVIYDVTESDIVDTSRVDAAGKQNTRFVNLVGQKRNIWKANLTNLLQSFGLDG